MRSGVNELYIKSHSGKTVKVFGNGMVRLEDFVDCDPEKLGIMKGQIHCPFKAYGQL